MTLEKFIAENGITMEYKWVAFNPNMQGKMPRNWKCTLYKSNPTKQMSIYFSQGSAHTEPPTAADVLDCLATDSYITLDCCGFEEWAENLGYDTDSRRAERIYNICKKQSLKLLEFLGQTAFETLVYDVERL